MLLVIFGAGASYDSVPHLPPPQLAELRPPLANQLFDTRPIFVEAMQRFGDCLAIIPPLRKPGIIVEQELAKLQKQAETFPRAHRELAAIRYYLHFAIWECTRLWHSHHGGITNYAVLLREIERWRVGTKEQQVCFVTFNYDTMLEEAMLQVLGFQLNDLSRYVSQQNYMLVKLHGSVNWGREVAMYPNANITPQHLINDASALPLSDQYRITNTHPMGVEDGRILYPALSIPVERKDQFSCPEEHRKALYRVLPQVTKIMTIGWRATELDFLGLLHSALARVQPELFVVSGEEKGANETLANLRGTLDPSGMTTSIAGFTGLTNELGSLEGFLWRNRSQ